MQRTPASVLPLLVLLGCGVEGHEAPLAAEQTIEPVVTRAGHVRYVGEAVERPAAYPVLVRRIQDVDSSAEDRAALVEALPRTGAPFGEFAVERLRHERDPSVRVALVGIVQRAAPDVALVGIEIGLTDGDPLVRAEAATVAGWIPAASRIAAPLQAALRDASPLVRSSAARSLGVLGVASAFDAVAGMLDDPNAEVRLQALHASERIDARRAATLPVLRDLGNDVDGRVARAAARLAGTHR